MDRSSVPLLTPFNYDEWKMKMMNFLKIKLLFGITMGTETEPLLDAEKPKWLNRYDKAYGISCLSVSPNILDQIISIESPIEIWTTLEGLFGKKDDLRENHLETELSICHIGYETSQNLFNKLDTYSPDDTGNKDSTSSISHEVVTDENSSLSNTEDDAHEEITSSTGEDAATTDEDTLSETIEEKFNPSTTDSANGHPTNGDTTLEEKEDFDSSDSDISNGAYVDFTIKNHEDYFSSLSDVVDHVADPLFEHFSDIQEFLADLDATRKMQSQFKRLPYDENFVSMVQTAGILVINPFHIHKACSQFWESLLATAIDPQCLDEADGLPQWDAIANSDLDFIGFRFQRRSCIHIMHANHVMHEHKSCMHTKYHMQIIMHAKHVMHAPQIMHAHHACTTYHACTSCMHHGSCMHYRSCMNIMHARNMIHAQHACKEDHACIANHACKLLHGNLATHT